MNRLRKAVITLLEAAQRRIESMPYMKGQAAFAAEDYAVALSWWQPLAEAGKHNAQYGVGLIHYRGGGPGLPRDLGQAIRWWRRAAAQGNTQAQNGLGIVHEQGEGVPKNLGTAIGWY